MGRTRNGVWTWTKADKARFEALGRELVVDSLVRSALKMDTRSIPGKIAYDRLMELAYAESPELVKKVQEERDRFIEGMNQFVASFAGTKKAKKSK